MSVEIRIIGTPEEVAEARAALKGCFTIHSTKQYPCRHGDDVRDYIRATPAEKEAATDATTYLKVPQDIAKLRIKLHDLGETNNIFLCYRFETDGYVDFSKAAELNRRIQDDIRDVIADGIEGVDGRLDQTFRTAEGDRIALYKSGGDWFVVPYRGGIE